MFYYSINSKEKVVHYEGCHHLKSIKADNLKSFKSIQDVRKSDYRLCSCCSPVMKHIKAERKTLDEYCLKNGLLYFVHKGDLYIRTYRSKWKILACDKKGSLELHHHNQINKEYADSVLGYHKQNVHYNSILGYFEYINEHDHYRMLNPLHIPSKKEPPKKGTRRYRSQQRAIAKKERKQQIRNVINLIDSLSVGSYTGA